MSPQLLGKEYAVGDAIVRQGEEGDCLFVIQEGEAEVFREEDGEEALVGRLRAGDMFGEMSIIEKEVRSATIRARTPVKALTIDRKTFLRRVQEDPSLAFNVLKAMSGRVRRMNAELARLKAMVSDTEVR
jgi:CRP-like cAMP-binding protein